MKGNNKTREGQIDLRSLITKFSTRWYYFALILLITLAAAFLYNKFSDQIFRVEGSIIIQEEATGSMGAEELFNVIPGGNRTDKKIEDEIGLIKSYHTVQQTLQTLDFGITYYSKGALQTHERYDNFPFEIVLDSSSYQIVNVPIYIEIISKDQFLIKIDAEEVRQYDVQSNYMLSQKIPAIEVERKGTIGAPYKDEFLAFTLNLTGGPMMYGDEKLFFKINPLDNQVNKYLGRLDVAPITTYSNILKLSTEGEVVNKEIAFLNALIDVVIQTNLNEKDQEGMKTIAFIDAQLATIADSLTNTEDALETFRSSNNLLNIGSQSANLIERLGELEAERAALRVKLNNYRNIQSYLNRDINSLTPAMASGIDDEVFTSLIIELSQLNQQKAGLNLSARLDNPILQQVEAKIANIRGSLEDVINSLLSSANVALSDVNSRITSLQSEVNRLPKSERRLVGIERQFAIDDETYNFLMQKKVEAGITLATNSPDIEIVDIPKMMGNGPVSAHGTKIYIIAFLLGLLIPATLILVIDAMNDKISGKEDLKAITDIPILGYIPHSHSKDPKAVYNRPRSAVAESFRTIRSNLNFFTNGNGAQSKVILITSSVPKEGKTFCSLNLATVFAMAGEKTILLEFDLRKPSVSKFLNVSSGLGLSEYLAGNAALKDVIYKVPDEKFFVISSGSVPPNPSELLMQERTRELIQLLKQDFDYIIIDSPPVGLVTDASILQLFSDKNIIIARQDFTTKEMLSNAQDLYEEKKIKNLSIILNDTKVGKKYSYYEE